MRRRGKKYSLQRGVMGVLMGLTSTLSRCSWQVHFCQVVLKLEISAAGGSPPPASSHPARSSQTR